MEVRLQEFSILTWQWHDSEVLWLRAMQSNDGDLEVCLRTEINPEEDRQSLLDMGINSAVVDVKFRRVSRLLTELLGECSLREVILDWTFAETDVLHHYITCSCGSKIDIMFDEISLEEVH